MGRRDDIIHFAGDGPDIMCSILVGLGTGFIEHCPEPRAAFLILL